MSLMPHVDPVCAKRKEPTVELEIDGRKRDLGDGFTVRRLLPSPARQMVGPFIFFDQMGPVGMDPGRGLDVRPHPHINLATVTYLFEGEILHRDSLGSEQVIRPGAVNWMTAGRGIVHSERSPANARKTGVRLHGLQLWVALPKEHEEVEPSFRHHPADSIPALDIDGAHLRVVAGTAYGVTSPVAVLSQLFYVEARIEAGRELSLPDEHAERALYVVGGAVSADHETYGEGTMVAFRNGARASVTAAAPAHVMLIGGAPLEGDRYIWWNFVSSSRERIEQAKADWRNRHFAAVPGDEIEFIPLPDSQ
jgi:redox-sensitive bicupin YhaK (pirin superfamily)